MYRYLKSITAIVTATHILFEDSLTTESGRQVCACILAQMFSFELLVSLDPDYLPHWIVSLPSPLQRKEPLPVSLWFQNNDTLVILLLWQSPWLKLLQEGRFALGSQFESTASWRGHQSGRSVSHMPCMVRRQTEHCYNSTCFPLFIQPKTSAHGIVPPTFREHLPSSVYPV